MSRIANKSAVVANESAVAKCVRIAFELNVLNGSAAQAAFALLADVKTDAQLKTVRDEMKAAYTARYMQDKGADETKCKGACDMFWSRTVARAKDMGWIAPEKELSDKAKAAQAKRDADKAKGGKVDGRTLRTGSRASNKAPKGSTVIVDAGDDEELQEAIDWVMDDETRMTLFVAWVESQKKATRTVRKAA